MEGDSKAVICEAPIDALSYTKLRHDTNDRTRYFAIGGQNWPFSMGADRRSDKEIQFEKNGYCSCI